jgi:hypothetical protein
VCDGGRWGVGEMEVEDRGRGGREKEPEGRQEGRQWDGKLCKSSRVPYCVFEWYNHG